MKRCIGTTFFPEGSVRTVVWGPCRGIRYRVFPEYGWAYLYGGWERSLVHLMSHRIARGSTVYDLGANYGMHTLLFARLVGPLGRVYAFEPHPHVFSCLQEQLELNDLSMVTPVCRAVRERTGSALFDPSDHRSTGHLTTTADNAFTVQTTTLDDFVSGGEGLPPDFIKIDIEGAESSAVRGALLTLQQHRPTMVIKLHNPSEDRAVGELLAGLNYVAVRVKDGSRVGNMLSGWPDLDGMWGTVLALPK